MSNNNFSKLGFILAAAGSAIGLGNIWKLPAQVAQYGGGTFLYLYLLISLTIGLTVMLAELALGRYLGNNFMVVAKGKLQALNKPKQLGSLFTLGGIPLMLILTFYLVVCGWILIYLVSSLTGALSFDPAIASADYYGNFFTSLIVDSNTVILCAIVFTVLTALINFKGLIAGVEKANFIMLPALFILLILMCIRSLTLPNAMEGVKHIFMIDPSFLTAEVFVVALKQSFFSLSLGFGIIVTYSSSTNKSMNLQVSALWTVILGAGIGIFTSLLIIPAAVSFGYSLNAGPALTFITLPNVFAQLPFGTFFAVLFFIVLTMAALTTTISLYEVSIESVKAWFKTSRNKAILGLLVFFIVTSSIQALSFTKLSHVNIGGKGIFDFSGNLADILLTLFGLLSCLFAGFIFPIKDIKNEITNNSTIRFPLFRVWLLFIRVISPIAILFLLYML